MPSKRRKHSRQRKRLAQKKAAAQAAAQAGQGDPLAVVPEVNGCPAPAPAVKIEDSAANKVHVADPLYSLGTCLTPSDPLVPANQQNAPAEKTEDKPQVVPTPLSTDNALDSLSAGFTSSASIAQVNEPVINDFSLPSTLSFSQPPVDKKTRNEEGSIPLDDAFNALGDTLAAPEPAPEPQKIDPKDIITEDDLTTDKGVLVGEREDTLPPDYRFTEKNGTDLPPPKEEKPPMESGEALDILSGDFMSQTPVTIPAGAPKQPCMEALDMLDGDFVATAAQEEKVMEEKILNVEETDHSLLPAFQRSEKDLLKAMGEDAPAIADLSGNFGSDMVPAQS